MDQSNRYFNVNLEFDRDKVDSIIEKAILHELKGYVCAIESNNLTIANLNPAFLEVVNSALVNICDGSVLALILGKIHKKKFETYIAADLFIDYIRLKKYKQFFLGNTSYVLEELKKKLVSIDPAITTMRFETLPFLSVEDFDYPEIAAMINRENPDIIWVSLGAPKQEQFMYYILPYLDKGIMFGVGAVFNFYSGANKLKRAPAWMRRIKLEWLFRAFQEPAKNIPRYWRFIQSLRKLINEEVARVKQG